MGMSASISEKELTCEKVIQIIDKTPINVRNMVSQRNEIINETITALSSVDKAEVEKKLSTMSNHKQVSKKEKERELLKTKSIEHIKKHYPNYIIEDVIGNGAYSFVYRCSYPIEQPISKASEIIIKTTPTILISLSPPPSKISQRVAVKVCVKYSHSDLYINEVSILEKLKDCKYTIKILDHRSDEGSYSIVTELFTMNLYKFMKAFPKRCSVHSLNAQCFMFPLETQNLTEDKNSSPILKSSQFSSINCILCKKKLEKEKIGRTIFYQLLKELEDCHSRNIVHLDIKPPNILVENIDSPVRSIVEGKVTIDSLISAKLPSPLVISVKIADFGSSSSCKISSMKTTIWWAAPEFFTSNIPDMSMEDLKKTDIWSLGITMIDFFVFSHTDKCVFDKKDESNIKESIIDLVEEMKIKMEEFIGILPLSSLETLFSKALLLSPKIKTNRIKIDDPILLDLLSKIIVIDPTKRISVSKALSHEYFSSLR